MGLIDALHHRLEEGTVGCAVVQAVIGDEIVDHLMNYGVFELALREVEGGAEAQQGIIVLLAAVRMIADFGFILADERGDSAERDGHLGEAPAEYQRVEIAESLANIWDCWFHDGAAFGF